MGFSGSGYRLGLTAQNVSRSTLDSKTANIKVANQYKAQCKADVIISCGCFACGPKYYKLNAFECTVIIIYYANSDWHRGQ